MTDQNELTKLQQEMEARKAELLEMQRKMDEAKRAEREARIAAERAAKLEAEREENKKLYAQYKQDAEAICAAVKELGYELSFEEPNFDHGYFPQFDNYNITFWTVGQYYRSGNGHPAVRVDVSGTPRTYKLRKDNTFNVQKIAESFVEAIKIKQAEEDRREKEAIRRRINKQLEQDVKAAVGLHEYSSVVSASRYKANKVDLTVRIPDVDAERAIEILAALKELGVELR